MPKCFRSIRKRGKKFSKTPVLLILVSFVTLVGLISISKGMFFVPSVPQNVLGEKTGQPLALCSSGSLSTSTNKVYQMIYPDETFLQLVNTDLLKDVHQLKDLTCLQYLDATDRNIRGDIANLKNLTNLEVFTLFSNPQVYGDICLLANATKLRNLKFAFDPKITGDISCLKNLTKLETFAMTHTQISGDLSVFANMPNLKSLYINGTKIKGNICSLSKLTNLEELGIADEAGNPDITGDLSCLDNLQKLKRVSIYNTGTTNCEQFTKSHQNILQMGKTESGRPAGGGCSKESQKTLVNVAQEYERKIGKEETEVSGKTDYQQDVGSERQSGDSVNKKRYEELVPNQNGPVPASSTPENKNFFGMLIDTVRNLFSRVPILGNMIVGPGGLDLRQAGPGGCKSQSECEAFCLKPENRETCSKFAPPGDSKGKDGEPRQAGPGGCKSQTECEAFCSKPENQQECLRNSP